MSGIMKAVNKNLERDIAKKLNILCGKYYNSNKKLQEMISKENFADVIKRANVDFTNGNLNVSVDPKDDDIVAKRIKRNSMNSVMSFLIRRYLNILQFINQKLQQRNK